MSRGQENLARRNEVETENLWNLKRSKADQTFVPTCGVDAEVLRAACRPKGTRTTAHSR